MYQLSGILAIKLHNFEIENFSNTYLSIEADVSISRRFHVKKLQNNGTYSDVFLYKIVNHILDSSALLWVINFQVPGVPITPKRNMPYFSVQHKNLLFPPFPDIALHLKKFFTYTFLILPRISTWGNTFSFYICLTSYLLSKYVFHVILFPTFFVFLLIFL